MLNNDFSNSNNISTFSLKFFISKEHRLLSCETQSYKITLRLIKALTRYHI